MLLALGQRENGLEAAGRGGRRLPRSARQARPRQGAARLGGDAEQYRHRAVQLSEREAGTERLVEAEAAYRLALEEYTRDKAPVEWAMVQNNLGNTLNALAICHNDVALYEAAAEAFRAALEVRTREHLPMQWAASQLNLGSR